LLNVNPDRSLHGRWLLGRPTIFEDAGNYFSIRPNGREASFEYRVPSPTRLLRVDKGQDLVRAPMLFEKLALASSRRWRLCPLASDTVDDDK
jgi:hypothetical protein